MRSRLGQGESYMLLILKEAPKYGRPAADPVV
jgi:hypothetical protein